MRALAALAAAVTLLAPAAGNSIAEYMKLRRQHAITQSAGVEALQTFVGKRILEVRGIVRGTIGDEEGRYLVLADGDSGSLEIRASETPDWLIGNEVPARLLIRASRASENGRISADLLGAAPEAEVASREPKPKPAPVRTPVPRTPPRPKSAKVWNLPVSDATPYYASFAKRRNPRLTDEQAWTIAQGVLGFSIQYGVDARLIMAMVMVESGFNPNAKSYAGAMGLGQLMPGTARGMGVNNAYDSLENLSATVRLVRGHLERYTAMKNDGYEGLVLSLAAYNAGSGAVKRHGGVPPYRETQGYVRKVIDIYRKLSGS